MRKHRHQWEAHHIQFEACAKCRKRRKETITVFRITKRRP